MGQRNTDGGKAPRQRRSVRIDFAAKKLAADANQGAFWISDRDPRFTGCRGRHAAPGGCSSSLSRSLRGQFCPFLKHTPAGRSEAPCEHFAPPSRSSSLGGE